MKSARDNGFFALAELCREKKQGQPIEKGQMMIKNIPEDKHNVTLLFNCFVQGKACLLLQWQRQKKYF